MLVRGEERFEVVGVGADDADVVFPFCLLKDVLEKEKLEPV